MPVTVRIPTPLRKFADGQAAVDVDDGAATVGDVLATLKDRYPGLAQRICDDSGEVRRFVNVFLGDEDIRFLDQLGTAVTDGAELSIIPAIAGGAATGWA